MLSVLIPVYNQNVVQLVEEVVGQCNALEIPFQVLVFDDNSQQQFKSANSHLGELFGVNYLELSTNLGRAKIRNRLAKTARFDRLLFLDCDSKITDDLFISNYVSKDYSLQVVYGGRVYGEAPLEAKKYLHWLYGTKVETPRARVRSKDPYLSFQSNNFMINSDVMLDNHFDEDVKGYGYEDLLFAKKLKEKTIQITHIDNPVLHDGLEDADTFLIKNKNAIANLKKINSDEVVLETRLVRFLNKLDRYELKGLFHRFIRGKEHGYLSDLKGGEPNLRKFAFLKALWYVNAENE